MEREFFANHEIVYGDKNKIALEEDLEKHTEPGIVNLFAIRFESVLYCGLQLGGFRPELNKAKKAFFLKV